MRRLYLAFLAGLQLGNARQQRFSIHDDLLAHPQVRLNPLPPPAQLHGPSCLLPLHLLV